MKDLKDYLHLYLGCGCVMNGDKFSMNEDYTSVVEWSDLGYPHNVKQLILRPLSDMTEDEKTECNLRGSEAWRITYPSDTRPAQSLSVGVIHRQAAEVAYMLSIGIDMFGLIESGLALDKTTLTQQ